MVFQEAFEWHIAVYLFLAGIGGGAIISAAIADLYDREKYLPYIKAASLVGMPMVAIGTVLLVVDLGQGLYKPWMLVYLFLNPTSAITWGTAILTLFIFASTAYAANNFQYISFSGGNGFRFLLIFLGIGTAGYTAVLLGVLKAIPFWHQTALPILFIISATSTGISASVLAKKFFLKEQCNLGGIERSHFVLLVLEVVLIAGMLLVALQGVPEMVFSVKALVVGKYSVQFWLFLIGVGLLAPVTMCALHEAGRMKMTASRLVTVEMMVLFGGFYLRYLIVHAGVYTEKFADYMLR